MEIILGVLGVLFAGLLSGSGAWPMKLMRRYQFEHWWFVAMVTGLFVIPWTVTLLFCPHLLAALQTVPLKTLGHANLWAAGWGLANVLCGLCYVRIGIGLTTAVLSGVGVCLGVAMPLVFRGSGSFANSPAILSPAGLTVLTGALVALLAVVLVGKGGSERDRAGAGVSARSGDFLGALLLAVVAGVFSCGYTLCFVYGQGPIITALKQNGASELASAFAVWALALAGGALVSVGYAVVRLTWNKSWGVLLQSQREFWLAALIGLNIALSIAFLGYGMLLMGALGGSVGSGLQTIAWMLGGQAVGFLSGEWRGAARRSTGYVVAAVGLLCLAAIILACGNFFARSGLAPHQ